MCERVWVAQQPKDWSPRQMSFTAQQWLLVASILIEAQLIPPRVAGEIATWFVDESLSLYFSQKFRTAAESAVVEVSENGDREVHVPHSVDRVFIYSERTPGLPQDTPPVVTPVKEHDDISTLFSEVATFIIGSGGFRSNTEEAF
jgi:hypothetical protein